MKKRFMALVMCVCMLLTSLTLTGIAGADTAAETQGQSDTAAESETADTLTVETAAEKMPVTEAPVTETSAKESAKETSAKESVKETSAKESAKETSVSETPTAGTAAPVKTDEKSSYKLTEQTITGKSSDGASVEIKGMLPAGAAAVIKPVTLSKDELAKYLGKDLAGRMDQHAVYDIHVTVSGKEYVIDDTVLVTVTRPDIDLSEGDSLTVQHVHEDEKTAKTTVETVDTKVTGDSKVSFKTDSFSLYIFVTGASGGVNNYNKLSVNGSLKLDGRWNAYASSYHSWSSSDPTIASVEKSSGGDDGIITAHKEGTVTITHRMDYTFLMLHTYHSETWNITVVNDTNAAGSGVIGNTYEFDGLNDKQWVNVIANVNGTIVPGAVVTLEFNDNNVLDNDNQLGGAMTGTGTSAGSCDRSTGAWFRHIDLGGTVRTTVTYVDPATGFKYSATANGSNTSVSCYQYRNPSWQAGNNSWSGNWYRTGPGNALLPGSLGYVWPTQDDTYGAVNELTVTLTKVSGDYNLIYDANGGTIDYKGISRTSYTVGPQSSSTFTVEKDIDDTYFTAARSGYTFLGWSTVKGATSAEFTRDETFNITGRATATLYAVWGQNPVTIIFKTDGNGTLEDLTSTSGTITKQVPAGTDLSTLFNNNEYPATHASTGYEFSSWDKTSGIVSNNMVITASFTRTAPVTANYTINYYKDSVSDANKLGTTTQSGTVDSAITVAAGTSEGQLDWKKPAIGYKSGVQQNTATVLANGSAVVNVLYETDPAQTKELSYTVQHKVNGTVKDTETVTQTVQVLQPDTLSIQDITLKSYPGFKYSDNDHSLALNTAKTALTGSGTIVNGGVIVVNYAPVDTTVTLTMHVSGEYADLTKEFTGKMKFTYNADGIEGNVAEKPYSLKNGEAVTASIKAGKKLSVDSIEDADGYILKKVVYKLNDGTETEFTVTSGATNAVDIPEGTVSVDVYYERDLVPDEGMAEGHQGAANTLIASLILFCAGYGVICRKRRRRDV